MKKSIYEQLLSILDFKKNRDLPVKIATLKSIEIVWKYHCQTNPVERKEVEYIDLIFEWDLKC